jgi:hypothetical protein
MILLPHAIRFALRANSMTARIRAERGQRFDPLPVLKLFNPLGAATWIATELDEDDDSLLGLADLGFGCPELGSFSLREIAAIRLPFGLAIERDLGFAPLRPLSVWAETARRSGSLLQAEIELLRATDEPRDT